MGRLDFKPGDTIDLRWNSGEFRRFRVDEIGPHGRTFTAYPLDPEDSDEKTYSYTFKLGENDFWYEINVSSEPILISRVP